MEQFVAVVLNVVGMYLLLGVLFSFPFLIKGITKVDQGAIGSGNLFKLLIWPGVIVFWPSLLFKWLKSLNK